MTQGELTAVPDRRENSNGRVHVVLHAVFSLTGIAHVIGGPLLPSVAATFHLGDSQSGAAFFVYFAGTSAGALLCRRNYAHTITFGFLAMALSGIVVSLASWPLFPLALFCFGVGVGVPMSAVNLFVGQAFRTRCAPMLTFLNFTWSLGALISPLIAARVLVHHSYKAAYVLLSIAALIAAGCSALVLRDPAQRKETSAPQEGPSASRLVLALCVVAAFLQVGIENTSVTWLSTYALRTLEHGTVWAAAITAVYWAGFLVSRGFCSGVLMRAAPIHVFRVAIGIALSGAVLLSLSHSAVLSCLAMLLLGVGLAPIYPLVIASFFEKARRISDSRWILATAGFGGSVLPWLAGNISGYTHSIRLAMLIVPVSLVLMMLVVERLTAEAVDPRAS